MIVQLLSLIALLVSSSLGASCLARRLGFGRVTDTLQAFIAWANITVAWCLVCAQGLGVIAEIWSISSVQMPFIAAVSTAGMIVLWAVTGKSSSNAVEPVASTRLFTPSKQRLGRIGWLAILLPVVLLHCFLTACAFLSPPSGYDGMSFHMPLIINWLESGNLSGDSYCRFMYLPSNSELWQMFFASLRFEPLINVSLVPIGLLLAVIVFAFSRELGAKTNGSIVVSLFVLACPLIALQMYSSYEDLFGTTFIAGALYWAILLSRQEVPNDKRMAYVFMVGLNVGNAMGAKFQMLPWAGGVILCLLVITCRDARLVSGSAWKIFNRRSFAWAWVLMLAVPICSGFWFFRSYYDTGALFYPMQIRLLEGKISFGEQDSGKFQDQYAPLHAGLPSLAYPWFEWKRSGYNYTTSNGLGPPFACFAVLGSIFFGVGGGRWTPSSNRLARGLTLMCIVGGICLFIGLLMSQVRWALPCFMTMLAASGLLVDRLLRTVPRAGIALISLTLILSAAMVSLRPARKLLSNIRDGDLSRAYGYQMPKLFDDLTEGTVVLNVANHTWKYPLLGAKLKNRVIDAGERGLHPPLSQSQLDAEAVEVIFFRGSYPSFFADDVACEKIFDDTEDPNRLPTTNPTRVYRILRSESSRFHQQSS